jgi:transcriptional regulator with XRE-family HTH domain
LATTLHDPRYRKLIALLVEMRQRARLSQDEVAGRMGRPQSFLGKIETYQRRLDALELFDLLRAMDISADQFAVSAEKTLSDRNAAKPRPRSKQRQIRSTTTHLRILICASAYPYGSTTKIVQ